MMSKRSDKTMSNKPKPEYFKTSVNWRLKNPADLDVLQGLLSLIDKEVSLKELAAWEPLQRAIAEDYAARLHLSASDNIVRLPQVPAWVKELPACTPIWELMGNGNQQKET